MRRNVNYVLLVVAAIAAVVGLSLWSQPAYDPDLGWHLFGGAQITAHRQVPDIDLINSFSTRWHDYHWLAQIILFAIYSVGSYQGLSVVLGMTVAFFAVVLVAIASRQGIAKRSPLLTIACTVFVIALMAKVTSVRPQMLALVVLSLTLYRLKGRRTLLEIPLLLLFAIFTANVHVYWVFIPLLYGIYRILPSLQTKDRPEFYRSIVILILLSSAAFISPYGLFHNQSGWLFENYALIYDYLLMPEQLRLSIGELQSSFASGGAAPFMLCIAIAIFVRGFERSDLNAHRSDLIVTVLGLLLAARATKFLAIFALFSFPYLLLTAFRVTRIARTPVLRPGSRLSDVLLTVAGVSGIIWAWMSFPRPAMIETELNRYLPIHACERIAELPLEASHGRNHIRVMTHFNYGGWCRWIMFQKAPERDLRVTIDGRTQWFPPDFFTRGLDLYNARFDWLKTLDEWSPDVVLVPRDKPLANVLALAKGQWKLEYEDPDFAVFLPVRAN